MDGPGIVSISGPSTLVRVLFCLNLFFRIKFKILILDLMLLPKKTVFHLKDYTTVVMAEDGKNHHNLGNLRAITLL